jgi:hypothetical protein
MRTSRVIYLAVDAVGLAAVIVLPGWLAGRSAPELGGVVVIPATGPASAPPAGAAPAPAGPAPPLPLPTSNAPVPGSGAVQVAPTPPLGAGHDDDSDRDKPGDDLDIGEHGPDNHGD